MAKVSGQLHSDLAKGSVGPVTHRVYCGTGTASKHRAPSRKRLTKLTIKSPVDIGNCWSRHSADIGYTLRTVGADSYLVSLSDQVGGFGTLSQSDTTRQPLWKSSDPNRNSRPYILPDGINDFLSTPVLTMPITQPLDIWFVVNDPGATTSLRVLFSLHNAIYSHLHCSHEPAKKWTWNSPLIHLLAPFGDGFTKVFRIVIDVSTIQVFWNGVPQSLPKALSPQTWNFLRLFTTYILGFYYKDRLFEITTFRRILNPVESQLLLHYYYRFYNLPAV